MSGYRFATHADMEDKPRLHRDLSDLNALTFGQYDGVVAASPSFMAWYTARPGMDPRLCQAVLWGEELVSSLLVTVARMRLAGETVACGIIDTVMTHPAHRRRGLARGMLERAIAAMGESGVEISLLNTAGAEPPAVPQRLYESLGYAAYAPVDRFVRRPTQMLEEQAAVPVPADEAARDAFAAAFGERSGWLEPDEGLWRWHRVDRPSGYPITVCRTADGGLGVLCTGDLLVDGSPRSYAVLSDLVASEEAATERALRSMVAAAPSEAPISVLCPRTDGVLAEALRATGFEVAGVEIAMLRPIAAASAKLVEQPVRSWYVAVESIVGV